MAFLLLQPKMLLLFFPVVLLLWILIKKEFLDMPEDAVSKRRKKDWRKWILISRIFIVLLLVVALAEPYGEVKRDVSGDPRITVLVDKSDSMNLFDMTFLDEFLENIKEEVPVIIREVGSRDKSDIGEGILANLEQNTNLLLITDGFNTEGANMGDVSLFATSTNSTISALQLSPAKADVGVSIVGPSKVVADLNTTYIVRVTKPGVDFYHIKVSIDGMLVIDADTNQEVFFIDQEFSEKGYHKIIAEVSMEGDDFFSENNVFYKVVNVIEKPKVVLVTEKKTPIEVILNDLYDVTKIASVPNNLEDFYTVIINDLPAEKLRSDKISEYLIEGNGLVVFGGFNSFDRGNYKNSVFEQVLPVKVGNAERKFSDNTIVISIDRSAGGGKCRTIIDTITKSKTDVCSELSYTDVIKAQAVELMGNFDLTNRVGVVAFDTNSYLVEPIDYLYNNKDSILDKVKRIQPGGNTLVSKGILGGYNLLSNEKGNKYVILLTDGVTWQGDQDESMGLTGNMFKQGIKVITIGIGRSVYDDFLKGAASNGGGFYLSASNKNKLKVLFGDPEKKDQGDTFGLFVMNSGHFITRSIDPDAVMKGYNQVLPKSSAELLITTDSAEPALTVWRYGLGKVATWNVFTGNNLGELLNERNSLLLTRTVNWAIGDPERKNPYYVNVEEGRVGKTIKVHVKSDKIPSAEGMQFIKVDKNLYEASLIAESAGLGKVLDADYAANYAKEYEDTGFNPELPNIVQSTGGNIFKPADVELIVDFVKSVSKKTVVEKTTIVWPWIMGAILLFLIEVLLRRLSENRRVSR